MKTTNMHLFDPALPFLAIYFTEKKQQTPICKDMHTKIFIAFFFRDGKNTSNDTDIFLYCMLCNY